MWVKIKLPRVKEHSRSKVIDIPDATSLLINALDFAVDPLGDSICQPMSNENAFLLLRLTNPIAFPILFRASL